MIENILCIASNAIPIVAYVDNKSVIEAVYSTKLVNGKRLRVDIAAISEPLARNEINDIKWCPGKIHSADCMTKRGATGYNLMNVLKEGRLPEDEAMIQYLIIIFVFICFNSMPIILIYS